MVAPVCRKVWKPTEVSARSFCRCALGPIPVGASRRLYWSRATCLRVVPAAELCCLRRTLRKPGFLKDRRDLGVRGEALPARLVPVEDGPDPVALIRIPKDVRPVATVLLSLLSALG